MHAITGHDTKFEVWLILKNRRRSGQDNIAEQDVFRVQPYRAVHRCNERYLDVEDIHEDFFALAIDFVVAFRRKEVEAFRAYRLHKRYAAAGQDDDAVIGI